jgi:hypothetical protein
MHAIYDRRKDRLADALAALPYIEGATGLVTAAGAEVFGAELFSRPSAAHHTWTDLVRGAALEARRAERRESASADDARSFVKGLAEIPCETYPSVGAGVELRLDGPTAVGSVLVHDGSPIYGWALATN